MMNRRAFVQQLGAVAFATKAMGLMAETLQAEDSSCYAPLIQEGIERARGGEIGEITHIFGYSYRDCVLNEPLMEAPHHIDVANRIFDSAPVSVIAHRCC